MEYNHTCPFCGAKNLIGSVQETYSLVPLDDEGLPRVGKELRSLEVRQAAAGKALDAEHIRSSDLLRKHLVATSSPFRLKRSRYKRLEERAQALIVLIDKAIASQ